MKPILSNSLSAVDATIDNVIPFSYYGNQPYKKNRMVIKNQHTNSIEYDETTDSIQSIHTIPANILNNGSSYLIQVQVCDCNDNWSDISDDVLLYCYSTPDFMLHEISNHDKISNSTLQLSIDYYQEEGESLTEYEIMLYDESFRELYNSGTIYYNDTNSTMTEINGLMNNSIYYARAIGSTLKNISLDTGYIRFEVQYNTPPVKTAMILENDKDNGIIKVIGNIVTVNYDSSVQELRFVNNSELDLTSNEYLSYNEGFSIDADFVLMSTLRNPTPYATVLTLLDDTYSISVKYMLNTCEESLIQPYSYFWLVVENRYTNYTLFSEKLAVLTESDYVKMYIKKKNNLYDFKVNSQKSH